MLAAIRLGSVGNTEEGFKKWQFASLYPRPCAALRMIKPALNWKAARCGKCYPNWCNNMPRSGNISTMTRVGSENSSTFTSTTRDIRYLQREETLLKSGDNVHIVPAIAGGNHFPTQAPLAAEEIQRYSRHLIMPEVGMQGQLKLRDASVLCIGAGGLGSPLGLYLAAAGVGASRLG